MGARAFGAGCVGLILGVGCVASDILELPEPGPEVRSIVLIDRCDLNQTRVTAYPIDAVPTTVRTCEEPERLAVFYYFDDLDSLGLPTGPVPPATCEPGPLSAANCCVRDALAPPEAAWTEDETGWTALGAPEDLARSFEFERPCPCPELELTLLPLDGYDNTRILGAFGDELYVAGMASPPPPLPDPLPLESGSTDLLVFDRAAVLEGAPLAPLRRLTMTSTRKAPDVSAPEPDRIYLPGLTTHRFTPSVGKLEQIDASVNDPYDRVRRGQWNGRLTLAFLARQKMTLYDVQTGTFVETVDAPPSNPGGCAGRGTGQENAIVFFEDQVLGMPDSNDRVFAPGDGPNGYWRAGAGTSDWVEFPNQEECTTALEAVDGYGLVRAQPNLTLSVLEGDEWRRLGPENPIDPELAGEVRTLIAQGDGILLMGEAGSVSAYRDGYVCLTDGLPYPDIEEAWRFGDVVIASGNAALAGALVHIRWSAPE